MSGPVSTWWVTTLEYRQLKAGAQLSPSGNMLGVQHRSPGLKPGRVVQTYATKCARTACEYLTHMCGPEQAVNVQLLAGEGNGKPPCSRHSQDQVSEVARLKNTADLSLDRALIISYHIIGLYVYIHVC